MGEAYEELVEALRPVIVRQYIWEDPPLTLWGLMHPFTREEYDRVYKTQGGANRGMASRRFQRWYDKQNA